MGINSIDENWWVNNIWEYEKLNIDNNTEFEKIYQTRVILEKEWKYHIPLPLWYTILWVQASWKDISDTVEYNWSSDQYRFELQDITWPWEITITIAKSPPTSDQLVPQWPSKAQQSKSKAVFDLIKGELWKFDESNVVKRISSWFKNNTRYWFDTETDEKLSVYKQDAYEYASQLITFWKEQQAWKHMMICNQSALLTKIFLDSQWIPNRIVSGLSSKWSTLWWVWHAWNEYRDQEERMRISIDNTPTQTPSKQQAPEMYQLAKDLWSNTVMEKSSECKDVISIALHTWILHINSDEYSYKTIDYIFEIISSIESNNIHTLRINKYNGNQLPFSLTWLKYLKNIDISDTYLSVSDLLTILLQLPNLENLFVSQEQSDAITSYIPPSLAKKIIVEILVKPWE
jgi:hypothetical protein